MVDWIVLAKIDMIIIVFYMIKSYKTYIQSAEKGKVFLCFLIYIITDISQIMQEIHSRVPCGKSLLILHLSYSYIGAESICYFLFILEKFIECGILIL